MLPESPGTHAERLRERKVARIRQALGADRPGFHEAHAALDALVADLEAVTRERDDAREWFDKHFVDEDGEPECATVTEMLAHVFQWGDGAWGCAGQQTVKAEAAEQRLETKEAALREIAEHRQDRSYNHATAHAYADVRDIARAALAEDK